MAIGRREGVNEGVRPRPWLSAGRFKGEVTPWVCVSVSPSLPVVIVVGSFKEVFRIRHLSPFLSKQP